MPSSDLSSSLRLVPILADGRPGEPGLTVTDDVAAMLAHTRDLYDRTGYRIPWISYLTVHRGEIVGGGAFVAPPQEGAVEIAYFTLPGQEGRGFAGQTAAALLDIARNADARIALWAKTLPEENASTRILARLGFRRDGTVQDHEIGTAWRWHLPPETP